MRHLRSALGGLVVVAAVGLAGCSALGAPTDRSTPIGGGAGGRPTAPSSPTTAAPSAKPTTKAKPKPAGTLADCLPGRWRLKTTKPTSGGSVDKVRFSGHGAFDLVFERGGDWRLVGRPKAPLTATVDIGGFPVSGEATVDGSASGRYRLVDTAAVFRLEETSGNVELRYPGGRRSFDMTTFAGSLVPDGTAGLRCSADELRIKAENVTLTLTPVGR